MKYNYVILATSQDYYQVAYADLMNKPGILYTAQPLYIKSPFINSLYRAHTSPTVRRFIKLPFQQLWNRRIVSVDFPEDKPICFVFFTGRRKEIRNNFVQYLRKTYPGCKTALFYQDLVKKSLCPDVELMCQLFDVVLTFDQLDADRYDLHYYPLVYSPIEIAPVPSIPSSDIYFVGKAKDRLAQIYSAYEMFRGANLKCDFHLIDVEPKDRRYVNEIVYREQMPYHENLQRINATKCMLEIMQGGGHGYTLRYCEAIMYNKKMITNNPEIKNAPFYRPEFIQVFSRSEDINPSFINTPPIIADYRYKQNLSPQHLLEYIDEIV